jgi:hypothetical protein
MSVRFVINHKITSKDSTNAIYSSKHWSVRKTKKDYFKSLIYSEIKKQLKFVKPFENPVMISFLFRSNLDIDNHSFIMKMAIDSMCGIVIYDDTKKYLKGVCMAFAKEDDIEGDIIVTVSEI